MQYAPGRFAARRQAVRDHNMSVVLAAPTVPPGPSQKSLLPSVCDLDGLQQPNIFQNP